MRNRYPLPRIWLVTDERQGETLWRSLRSLPRSGGVIVRHYSLEGRQRRALFTRIRAIARQRGLTLLLAAETRQARCWRADGFYAGPEGVRGGHRMIWAAAVHDLREIRQAERRGAGLLLLSPLFPTRSHPGAPALGVPAFARLARASRLPVIALGGVQPSHWPLVKRAGGYGWSGIDAFTRAGSAKIRI